MQNLTYGQKETALILAGRTRAVQPSGDLFAAVYDYTTVTEYNNMRTAYLQMETDIAALYQWNRDHPGGTQYTVTGKNSDNGNVNINDDPDHPFPPIKN